MTTITIAFIIVALAALTETIFTLSWNQRFLNLGPIVFKRTFHAESVPTANLKNLHDNFKSRFTLPLVFKEFRNGDIAFREGFAFVFFGLTYTPIMRGRISISDRKVMIIGRLSLFSIVFPILFFYVFLMGFASKSQSDQEISMFVVIGFLVSIFSIIYGSIYLIQFIRFSNVGKYVSEKQT